MTRVSVMLVDDHDLFREGVASILSRTPRIVVVGQAATAGEALDAAMQTRPDVILLDVELPDAPVTATLARLLRIVPETRIIILTMHRDRVLASRLLRAGASAFLTKSAPSTELVETILGVSGRADTRAPDADALPDLLSEREHEVLRLVADARSNAEIAESLSITVGTVKRHTHSIYRKLGASSRLDAVRRAERLGIVTAAG